MAHTINKASKAQNLDHHHNKHGFDTSGDHVLTSDTGPSSSQSPYLVPVDANPATAKLDTQIGFVSLLTTGDQVGFKDDGVTPWRMAGTPDGLGAFDNGDGT